MDYLDFIASITERGEIKNFIESDAGVEQQEGKLYSVFAAWWQLHAPDLGELPKTKKVMELRGEFLHSFVDSLEPVGLLDRFKVAGVVASWWDEVKYELRTLSESDFGGLVDSWVDTIRDALEQDDDTQKNQTKFDPLNHKLVVRLMPKYLEEIADAEARIAQLEQQKEMFERGEEAEAEEGEVTEEDSEAVNFAKELETRLKTLKDSIKEAKKEIKDLRKNSPLLNADKIAEFEDLVEPMEAETAEIEKQLEPYKEAVNFAKELETRLKTLKDSIKETKKEIKDLRKNSPLLNADKIAELEDLVEPMEAEIAEIEKQLEPYKEIKKQLNEAKGRLRTLKNELVKRLEAARTALTDEDCEGLVLAIFKDGLIAELERYVTAHRQQVIVAVENWWDKYRVTLQDIETERDAAAKQLSKFLGELGYYA
jgi:type I restriction enzyme M protein